VHLAAVVGVRLVVDDAVGTLQTNIAGTESVLRVAARHGVKVLVASTSEVYGKSTALPFREGADTVFGPTSKNRWSYAASKMVDEFLALGYHRQFAVPTVVFRLFNTVGPRQTGRYGMVVPRFVDAAMRGDDLLVHGDGEQRRCFVHVLDAVAAIDALSTCPTAVGEVFNIGSRRSVSILELANLVRERAAPYAKESSAVRLISYEEVYGPGFEDMRAREPDIAKVAERTGWAPHRSLEEIIDDVVAERRGALALT
jgi:UDP-glucose 4-epimerase